MANVKISQLPEYTGNTSGSWLVMNNSGESTTYKVERETLLSGFQPSGNYATTGSNTFVGDQTITGSVNLNNLSQSTRLNIHTNFSNPSGIYFNTGSNNLANLRYVNSSNVLLLAQSGSNPIWIGNPSGSNVLFGSTTISGSLTESGSVHRIVGNTTITGSVGVTGSIAALNTINGKYSTLYGGQLNIVDSAVENIAVLELGNLAFGNIPSASFGNVTFSNDTLGLTANKITLTGQPSTVTSVSLSGSLVVTGSASVIGNTTITGSLVASGSAGHTLIGTTNLSGSLFLWGVAPSQTKAIIFAPSGSASGSNVSYSPNGQGTLFISTTGAASNISIGTNTISGTTTNVIINSQSGGSNTINGRTEISGSVAITGSLFVSSSTLLTNTISSVYNNIISSGPMTNNNNLISANGVTGYNKLSAYTNILEANTNIISGSLTVTGSASVIGSINVTGTPAGLAIDTNGGTIIANVLTSTGSASYLSLFSQDDIQLVPGTGKRVNINNMMYATTSSVNITGSVNISAVMNLAKQNPLPTGTTGSLAVSGSGLYFHNGTSWTLIS